MMPKILFRVDANDKIGWGHFYRSLSLADMLKGRFNITFAMADMPAAAASQLTSRQFEIINLPGQEYTTPDQRGDKELNFDLQEVLGQINIVLLDGYWFGPAYQKKLRNYPVKIALIEDTGYGSYQADIIINHAPGISQKSYHTDTANPLFALGSDYALLRSSFLKEAKNQTYRSTNVENVLISFGGSDPQDLTLKTVKWLLEYTRVYLHIIIGISYQNQQGLESLKTIFPKRLKIERNLNENEMLSAMKNADAAILPSSGVLFESIACRLPAISGYYTQNQYAIFKGFLNEKVIIDGGDFSNLQLAWSELNSSGLAQIKERQMKMIDGDSGERFRNLFNALLQQPDIKKVL